MPTTAFPSRSLSLATLFRHASSFSVPSFQRPYEWTTRESGQLLEDIAAAAGNDEEVENRYDYFLGTILVLCHQPSRLLGGKAVAARRGDTGGPSAAGESCQIIDGQQRLVTLTILAAVLRDLDDAPSSLLRERLETLIGGSADADAGHKLRLNSSDQRFLVDFVLSPQACAEMPGDETLSPAQSAILATREHFMGELSYVPAAERARLARYLLDHCFLVVIATDEIDRAHRIFVVLNGRGLPLRREDILKAEIGQALPRERAEELLARWDAVALRLGKQFEHLFSYIRIIHGDARPQIITAIRGIVAARGGGEAFITRDLEPLGEALATVINPWDETSDLDLDVRRHLVYLNRLAGTDWVPAAMLAVRLHRQDPARTRMLIAGIDRLAHATRIMCLGSNKRHQRFAAVMSAIEDGSISSSWDGPFALSRDDVRVLQFNLRDPHVRAPSVCKLILMRLEDEITGLLPSYSPSDFNVEHVLPVRPPATSAWRRAFPDANRRMAATHSLGNLTLVTPKQNERARNEEFERKRQIYEAPEVGRPVLALTRELVACERWDPAEVEKREARLLALIARMWQLPSAGGPRGQASQPDGIEANSTQPDRGTPSVAAPRQEAG